jgi:hypothetical protein
LRERERASEIHIRLSLVLLAIVYVAAMRYLPPLPAFNMLLVVGFGYFIFKAGYTQAELPLYVFVFFTFLVFCHLLKTRRPWVSLVLAVVGGALGTVAHLTKASFLPLVGVLVAVLVTSEITRLARTVGFGESRSAALKEFGWRSAAAVLVVASFLAVMYPYISTSKRVFGHYFDNVNTTFYVWYDNWPLASWGTYRHFSIWPRLLTLTGGF